MMKSDPFPTELPKAQKAMAELKDFHRQRLEMLKLGQNKGRIQSSFNRSLNECETHIKTLAVSVDAYIKHSAGKELPFKDKITK
jgi:hypothetical protein